MVVMVAPVLAVLEARLVVMPAETLTVLWGVKQSRTQVVAAVDRVTTTAVMARLELLFCPTLLLSKLLQ
jgi:hypothetical protein